jgi:hypothetical protein
MSDERETSRAREHVPPTLSSVSAEELARIEAEVATWPPPTQEQVERIRALFAGGGDA